MLSLSAAQTDVPETWQLTFEDIGEGEIKDMIRLPDGDLVIAGFINTAPGYPSENWLARIDANGNLVWSELFGSDVRDEALKVTLGPDDRLYVQTWEYRIPSQRRSIRLLHVFSLTGEKLWSTGFAESPKESTYIHKLRFLKDGAVLVLGASDQFKPHRDKRPFLVKADADGAVIWRVDPPDIHNIKETYQIALDNKSKTSARRSSDGELYVDEIPISVDLIENQYFELRTYLASGIFLNPNPENDNPELCYRISLEGSVATDMPCNEKSSPVDPEDRFYGGSSHVSFRSNPRIIKTDENGKTIWKTLLTEIKQGSIYDTIEAADGNHYAVGVVDVGGKNPMHAYDGFIAKLDQAGRVLWLKSIGGSRRDGLRKILQASDGSLYVAGYTGSQRAVRWSPWLMKLTSDGELTGDALEDLEAFQE